ncbi:MAG: hypothetical protein KF746_26255 [Chitinophagaceae bacterium]|nr:hypothetical protein [Chitinophagaceae bacterium]
MVAVFKTTVNNKKDAKKVLGTLETVFTSARINFDLEDCDNILRVEANNIDIELVQKVLFQHGHHSELLV